MSRDKSKLLEEIKRRAEKKEFKLEEYCFDKQLAFIQDPAKFKTAVCSRRCLAIDTLVQTLQGPKKIQDITTDDLVYDENGQLIKVLEVFDNGEREVVEVTQGSRVLVEATLDHEFLMHHDRVKLDRSLPLKHLYKGLKIVKNEIIRNEGINIPYAYAIGALLGDGCSVKKHTSYITVSSENNLIPEKIGEQFKAYLVKKCHPSNYNYNIYAQEVPEEYKLWCESRYAHEKICDIKRILTWNRESRLAFLAGLIDTDGSVVAQDDGIQIRLSMQAKSVVDAASILFLDLWNYKPSIYVDNRDKYKNGPVYNLSLKHNYFGKKILKELTPHLVTNRKKFKIEYENKLENNYNPKYIGVKLGKKSIKKTFDIRVDSKTNLYTLANGLITHNSGKSIACAADLIHTALTKQGDVAYITLNRRSAKRIIWRALMDINNEYDLGGKPDNTELTLIMPNRNIIHVSGAKDESDAEKLRGMALRKVYIDECQSFRGYIEPLIDDIIEPALTDYDGSLILIGTPGPVPSGYFYDASHNPGWSHHHWTLHDNPWIQKKSGKTAEQIIQERCVRRGIKSDDPSILREYYGQWIKDEDSLVYKFNPTKNLYEEIPEDLKYVIGIDIGWEDADAIAVLGYSHKDKNVYLAHEYISNKQTISDLVERIKELETIYKPVKIVMDAGALGKKIQEEIRQRHRVSVHAAEKTRKLEFIELLNDDLRTGKFKAAKDSRFQEDAMLVQWDFTTPGKPKISDVYHTDIGDAVLYAWRECRHFLYETPEERPAFGSDAYMDKLEEMEAQKMEEQDRRKREEEGEIHSWADDIDPYSDDF